MHFCIVTVLEVCGLIEDYLTVFNYFVQSMNKWLGEPVHLIQLKDSKEQFIHLSDSDSR